MLALTVPFMTSLLVAQATTTTPPSPAPSAPAMASPAPAASDKKTLTLDIPHSWRRTQSGQYNEWRGPDGRSNFRVAPMAYDAEMHGPGAAAALKKLVVGIAARYNPNAEVNVITVMVCNGTQPAYRFDDVLGMGTPAFMMFIPGATSSGFINYEIFKDGQRDPGIMAAIDKICWP